MAKTRISISLEKSEADRLRAAAARAGRDLSDYIRTGMAEIVDRDDLVSDVFADIDARITQAEEEAAAMEGPPPPVDGEISAEEQQRANSEWAEFLNERRSRGAA